MALAASAVPLEGLAPATDALIVPGLSSGSSRRAAARCFRARAQRPDHAWPRDRRVLRARLLHDAVQAVDALQLAKPRQPLVVAVDVGSRIPPTPPGVVRDSATLSRLRRSIAASWPPPEEVKPQCALRELLRTNDVYNFKNLLTVIPYDEEYLRLARRPLRPQVIHKLVTREAADMIMHPYMWIVMDDDLLAMVSFLKILHRSGLLFWRHRIRSRVGCFFVVKRDEVSHRLVVDARAANACHQHPPRSALAMPGVLAELNFSGESPDFQDSLDDYEMTEIPEFAGSCGQPVEGQDLPAGP